MRSIIDLIKSKKANNNLSISGVTNSKINKNRTLKYTWYIKTKKLDRIPFYLSNSTINPMKKIEEFDKGDYWEVDCRIDTGNIYKESPYDNSFVLIPKKDVIDVWYEEN